jgi:LPS O-antigen subunit length determinant protein (WzzB/FepE family)
LAYSVYNSVAQKRIQARMSLQENTPVFKTLQTANVPLERNEPQWIPIIIFSIAVGFVLSFVIIAGGVILRYMNEPVPRDHVRESVDL